jgi:hypothetical protein
MVVTTGSVPSPKFHEYEAVVQRHRGSRQKFFFSSPIEE